MKSSRIAAGVVVLLALIVARNSAQGQSKLDSLMATMTELSDTAKVRKLNALATSYSQQDLALSQQLAQRALELSLETHDRPGEAESLARLSTVLMRQGQFAAALSACRQAEEIYASVDNKFGVADIVNTRGMVYNLQGQYPMALENFTKALALGRELRLNDFSAKVIENIGIIHFRQADYNLALDYFRESYDSYKALGNEGAASKILVNLGATYNKLNMPDKALDSHMQSLAYFEKTNSVTGMGIAYNNIGSVYFNLKDFNKAIASYTKSLELKRKMNDKRGIAVSLKNIAEAYIMLNNLDKAKQHIDESRKLAEEIGSQEQIRDAYAMLSMIYEKKQDYVNALKYEKKMTQANDSLFSADKTSQISRMRAIYETEKAEQEATLTKLQADYDLGRKDQQQRFLIVVAGAFMVLSLMAIYLYRQKQKSNELLSEKNKIVERSLQERETLLKEIHHRVKNNLQIISSLLSLQSKSLHDADAQGAINESRNRVKSMSLIHEQLYQEHTISGVDMKDYMSRLVNSLVASYGLDTDRVAIKIDADQILLDVDSAIPLGLILNELVSNSMKYAFPDLRSGTILISLKDMMDELKLVVQDNGVGMESAPKGTQSFGLSMVNSLNRKLKAEMKVISKAGTCVELIIRDFKKVTFA